MAVLAAGALGFVPAVWLVSVVLLILGADGQLSWSATTPTGATQPQPRSGHVQSALPTGGFLSFGGVYAQSSASTGQITYYLLQDTLTFSVVTRQWSLILPSVSPQSRAYASLHTIGTDLVLVGGMCSVSVPPTGNPCVDKAGVNIDVWRFDSTAFTWTQVAANGAFSGFPAARYGHAAAYDAGSSSVFVYGGTAGPSGGSADSGVNMLTTVWQLSWSTKAWTAYSATVGPTATALMASSWALRSRFCGAAALVGSINDYSAKLWVHGGVLAATASSTATLTGTVTNELLAITFKAGAYSSAGVKANDTATVDLVYDTTGGLGGPALAFHAAPSSGAMTISGASYLLLFGGYGRSSVSLSADADVAGITSLLLSGSKPVWGTVLPFSASAASPSARSGAAVSVVGTIAQLFGGATCVSAGGTIVVGASTLPASTCTPRAGGRDEWQLDAAVAAVGRGAITVAPDRGVTVSPLTLSRVDAWWVDPVTGVANQVGSYTLGTLPITFPSVPAGTAYIVTSDGSGVPSYVSSAVAVTAGAVLNQPVAPASRITVFVALTHVDGYSAYPGVKLSLDFYDVTAGTWRGGVSTAITDSSGAANLTALPNAIPGSTDGLVSVGLRSRYRLVATDGPAVIALVPALDLVTAPFSSNAAQVVAGATLAVVANSTAAVAGRVALSASGTDSVSSVVGSTGSSQLTYFDLSLTVPFGASSLYTVLTATGTGYLGNSLAVYAQVASAGLYPTPVKSAYSAALTPGGAAVAIPNAALLAAAGVSTARRRRALLSSYPTIALSIGVLGSAGQGYTGSIGFKLSAVVTATLAAPPPPAVVLALPSPPASTVAVMASPPDNSPSPSVAVPVGASVGSVLGLGLILCLVCTWRLRAAVAATPARPTAPRLIDEGNRDAVLIDELKDPKAKLGFVAKGNAVYKKMKASVYKNWKAGVARIKQAGLDGVASGRHAAVSPRWSLSRDTRGRIAMPDGSFRDLPADFAARSGRYGQAMGPSRPPLPTPPSPPPPPPPPARHAVLGRSNSGPRAHPSTDRGPRFGDTGRSATTAVSQSVQDAPRLRLGLGRSGGGIRPGSASKLHASESAVMRSGGQADRLHASAEGGSSGSARERLMSKLSATAEFGRATDPGEPTADDVARFEAEQMRRAAEGTRTRLETVAGGDTPVASRSTLVQAAFETPTAEARNPMFAAEREEEAGLFSFNDRYNDPAAFGNL